MRPLPREWAIRPEALEALLDRWHAVQADMPKGSALSSFDTQEREVERPFAFADGVARIQVRGVLTSDVGGWDWLFGGGSSYGSIAKKVRAAAADPAVAQIVLDIDSPGGDVAGLHDAAEAVYAARQQKPVIAYSSGVIASAAYWLASAATRIVVAPSAVVGSLGCMVCARDFSEAMSKAGIKRIVIRSSDTPRKSLDPATPEGAADAQVLVDQLADAFQAALVRYRGAAADGLLERLQGRVEVGPAAVAAGLVDGIAGPSDAWLSQGGAPPSEPTHSHTGDQFHQEPPAPFVNTPSRAHMEAQTLADNTAQSVADPSGDGSVRVSAAELVALRAKAGQVDVLTTQVAALTSEKADAEATARAAEQLAAKAQAASAEHEARIRALEERDRLKARDAMLDKHAARGALTPATRSKWAERADQLGVEAVDAMLADIPTGAVRPVAPKGYSGSNEVDEAAGPKSHNDLAAMARAEQDKARAEGKPVPTFGEVYQRLAAQHPDIVRAQFGGGEVSHA